MKALIISLIMTIAWAHAVHAQVELITDGGFDLNSGKWKFESSPGTSRAAICTGDALSAPRSGCINGNRYLTGEGAIYQSISIPTCVTSCTLTFYYHIVTNQNTSKQDVMNVSVTDLNNNSNSSKLASLSNLDAHSTYFGTTREINGLGVQYWIDHYSTAALVFHGNNVSGLTAFQIDDVSMTVKRGMPIVDFSVFGLDPDSDHITIAPHDNVEFVNLTVGLPTSYYWKFYMGPVGSTYLESTDREPYGEIYENPGKYAVSLTATNEMGTVTRTKTQIIHVTPHTGIEAVQDAPSYGLATYPNPVTNTLNVELQESVLQQESRLTIINQIGEVVINETIPAHTALKQYDISEQASGFYFICLQAGATTLTQKIIKK